MIGEIVSMQKARELLADHLGVNPKSLSNDKIEQSGKFKKISKNNDNSWNVKIIENISGYHHTHQKAPWVLFLFVLYFCLFFVFYC
ncbi:MAG: hypothetical protein GY828_07415 [Candidatus Gracilibacteria bacterium]|nr:hypothetical protein [Candidatus Gracilibacteria bacterium]